MANPASPTHTIRSTTSGVGARRMTETTPLLRARYSNGYDEPPPRFGLPALESAVERLGWMILGPNGATTNGGGMTSPIAPITTGIGGGKGAASLTPATAALSGSQRSSVVVPSVRVSLGAPDRSGAVGEMEALAKLSLSSVYAAVPDLQNLQRTEQVAWTLSFLLWLYTRTLSPPNNRSPAPGPLTMGIRARRPSISQASVQAQRLSVGGVRASSTWERWKRIEDGKEARLNLEKLLNSTWEEFIEVWKEVEDPNREGPDAVEDLLWMRVPVDEAGRNFVRVVDLLVSPLAPPSFVSHPLVLVSLSRTWESGFTKPAEYRTSWWRFDSFSVPQVSYAVHLVYHFIYVYYLCNLVLEAPAAPIYIQPAKKAGLREALLLIYSVSSLRLSFASLPYAIIAASVGASYPTVPIPNTTSHSLLLLSLSLTLLQLHLPIPHWIPTPIYLFNPARSVPLATLVGGLLRRAVLPTIRFFGITLVFLFALLSIALADSFPLSLSNMVLHWFNMDNENINPDPEVVFATGPSHPQTRMTLLLLWLAASMTTAGVMIVLVLIFPSIPTASLSSAHPATAGWDSYGAANGFESKINFITTVVRHASPPIHTGRTREVEAVVPAPFNIPTWLLGNLAWVLGRAVGASLGDEGLLRADRWRALVRQMLWRVSVGLPGLLVAGLWFWRA